MWSNSRRVAALDAGPLGPAERLNTRQTTVRYKDSQGRQRFKGNEYLKCSQKLGSKLVQAIANQVDVENQDLSRGSMLPSLSL